MLRVSAYRSVFKIKASILVIALWSICFLSTLAVIIAYSVRMRVALSGRISEREKLVMAAESGVKRAIFELSRQEPKEFVTLLDSWLNNPSVFKEIKSGDSVVDVGYVYPDEDAKASQMRYGLIDEERKVNINKADTFVLRRLFQLALGLDDVQAQELAASVIDWRDPDNELSIPLGSAEESYYSNLTHPYAIKNNNFEVLEELLLVKGMDEQLFERLKDYVTIYGDGRINVNTASRVALIAVGLREDIADKLIELRNGADKLSGTLDDIYFDAPESVAKRLQGIYNFSEAALIAVNSALERYAGTNSQYFTANSRAHLEGRQYQVQVFCVMDIKGRVLRWQES